jgi:hypothetical protein
VSDAVTDITFQYLDPDDNILVNPHLAVNAALIRTVVVTITTRPDTQSYASAGKVAVTTTMRTRVRNRS